jgi:hypothetical protein
MGIPEGEDIDISLLEHVSPIESSNGKTSFFTASMCSTRTTFTKTRMLHGGHDDHPHPDIHVACSPAHVDQIHPRQNRDARQTEGDDNGRA